MAGVYDKFISKYQVTVEPIRRLKVKDVPFEWATKQEQVFNELKKAIPALPSYLKQPKFKIPFELLHCDAATSAGIAVILCQRYDGTPHYPLAFTSRSVTKYKKKTTPFVVALVFVSPSIRLHGVLRPGKVNHAADALSRAAVHSISSKHPAFDWALEQRLDPLLSPYFNNVNLKYKKHKIIDGILYKVEPTPGQSIATEMFIVVPSHLITNAISKYHGSTFAGHGDITKTKTPLDKAHLYWTNMKNDINQYVKKCRT